MFEDASISELKQHGFIGAIACNSSGAITDATSDDLEVFGSILGYLTQVADMIGEPFGMDSIEEIQIAGANTTAVCIPQEDGSLGVLCTNRANIDGILTELIG